MNTAEKTYNSTFQDSIIRGSLRSAEELVPYIIKLFNPKSVIDIGCGYGGWLHTFKQNGVERIRGVENSDFSSTYSLISQSEYTVMNLEHIQTDAIKERFDLAITLEVAEHVSQTQADQFVSFLQSLADIIVFSSAVPRQGGTLHINEQWPGYWQDKFAPAYVMTDPLRAQIQNNHQIEWWYRQNIFVLIKKELYEKAYIHFPIYNSDFITIHQSILKRYTSPYSYFKQRINNILQKLKAKIG